MNKPMLLSTVVVLASIGGLASCNFDPPSKAWKDLIDKPLRIETLDCIAASGSTTVPTCHLKVVNSQPERYLRITKPMFGDYRIAFETGGPDKSGETEIGMKCTALKEDSNYVLSKGECVMVNAPGDDKSGQAEPPHVHKIFSASRETYQKDGQTRVRVRFSFDHDGPGPRHNGTGHTE